MKLNEFVALMERIAPPQLAIADDNVGLLVGPDHDEVRHVLVALDLTVRVAHEAAAIGADLVLTHHPQFFRGVKRMLPDHPDTAAAYALIRHGIGHYAAHTNFDAAIGGVNDVLTALLDLCDIVPLPPENLGRVGSLKTPLRLAEFAKIAQKKLGDNVRFCGDPDARVSLVAVVGGGGDSELESVKNAGADTFVTGEIRHHRALAAAVLGINVVTAGHYETEHAAMPPLIARLQSESNDVQYSLAHSEASPFCSGFTGRQEGNP